MPTPIEAGYYWVTTAEHPEPFVAYFDGQPPGWEQLHRLPPLFPLGTWGERIPSSDQITARREVVAIDPHDNGDCCPLCHCWSTDDPPHDPTCPWIRAQDPPHAPTP